MIPTLVQRCCYVGVGMLCERSLATAGLIARWPSSEIISPERQKRLGTSPSRSKGATIVSIKLFRLGHHRFEHIFEVTPHESQYTLSRRSCQGGAEGIRTPDLRLAKAAFSQLNYGPSATHEPSAFIRQSCADPSGPLWTRTTDLPLIRGML